MYIEINSNNQVMGYSDSETFNSVQTDKTVPSFTDTQILKFVNGDFVVEDSQSKIDKKEKWVAQEYARNRASAYDSIGNQLDLLFHDFTAGKGTKTGEWYKAVAKVKSDNPKG